MQYVSWILFVVLCWTPSDISYKEALFSVFVMTTITLSSSSTVVRDT